MKAITVVYPYFTILVLVAFTASMAFSLVLLRGGFILANLTEPLHIKSNSQAPITIFNDTLLALAATDLNKETIDSDVTELLTGSFHNLMTAYWHWCVDVGSRLKPTDNQTFMVNFKKDLVNWSDRRHPHKYDLTQSQSQTPLFLNSAKYHNYASCAVVGNSGILLQSEHGEFINSHEVVIRLNNAKVNGFEKHVGSTTNISFINSNVFDQCIRTGGCECNPYGPNTTLITYICQSIHLLDVSLCNMTSTASTLLVTDPSFDQQCGKIVKYYSLKRSMEQHGNGLNEWLSAHDGNLFHYSSGMQAVMLALRICDKVSIFGFGKGDLNSRKHHYNDKQNSELRLHDYDAEYELYSDLIRRPWNVPFLDKEFKVPHVAWHR